MKRLLMATVAMLVALAWAGAATAAARRRPASTTRLQRRDARRDSGSRRRTISSSVRTSTSPRTSTGRAAGRLGVDAVGRRAEPRPSRWIAHRRRRACGHDDALRPGRSLDFAATFTADVPAFRLRRRLQRCAPWAMFSTGGGRSPVGLYARTLGGAATGEHADRRRRSDSSDASTIASSGPRPRSRYFVDGDEVATHAIAITAQLRPLASDFNVGGGSVAVELDLDRRPVSRTGGHVHVARLRRRRQPRHLADADRCARYAGRHRRRVRGPHRKHADAGCLVDRLAAGRCRRRDLRPVGRRYLQYRATLTHDGHQRHARSSETSCSSTTSTPRHRPRPSVA